MADTPKTPATPNVSASGQLRWNAGLPGLTWVGTGSDAAAARARDEAAAKAQVERLQRIDAYRGAAEETIKNVRDYLFQLLLVGTYLALTFAGTSDVQLLKGDVVKLPLIDVGIPIVGFYLIAPGLYLLLHLNLLLQIGALGQKLRAYRAEVMATDSAEVERAERTKLITFPLSRAIMGGEPSRPMALLVNLYTWTAVLFLPVALLIFALVRFLPYHEAGVTWAHRAYLIADLTLAWIILPRALSSAERSSAWWAAYGRSFVALPVWNALIALFKPPQTPMLRIPSRGALSLTGASLASLIFLWAATFPGEWLDRLKLEHPNALASIAHAAAPAMWPAPAAESGRRCRSGPCDWLTYELFESSWTVLRRNLNLRGANLVSNESKPEDIAAVRTAVRIKGYEARGKIDSSLEKIGGLGLQNRDLRYADLRDAFMPKADLRGARLDGVDARNAMLAFADFRPAIVRRRGECFAENPSQIIRIDDEEDRLQFEGNEKRQESVDVSDMGHGLIGEFYCRTRAPGANFGHAYLVGSRFDLALIRQAKFANAQVSEAVFSLANAQKAWFRLAVGRGAIFNRTNLLFADFSGADMSGASFVRARLEMSDFSYAILEAADFSLARLVAALFRGAILRGSKFHPSEVGAIATDGADFEYADVSRLRRGKVTVGVAADIVWLAQRDGNDAHLTLKLIGELQALVGKGDDFGLFTFAKAHCRRVRQPFGNCINDASEADFQRGRWENVWRGIACGEAPVPRVVESIAREILFRVTSRLTRADTKLTETHTTIAMGLLEDTCLGKAGLKPAAIRQLKAIVPSPDAAAQSR